MEGVEYLGTALAAGWLKRKGFRCSPATLRQWRWKGVGPKFTKLTCGGEGFYKVADLEAYVAARVYGSTGDVQAMAGR